MTTSSSDLGRCPLCESPVPADRLLAEVGTSQPTTFAECPTCEVIVCPTDAVLSER